MKKSEVLFLAIGGLEGTRLEATEMPAKRARPRFLLVAAIAAAALLLVGCAAAVYARIHITYTRHEDITATVSQTDNAEGKNVLTDCYPQTPCPGYVLSGGAPIDRTTQNLRYWSDAGTLISFSISTSHAIDGVLAPPCETSTVTVSGWEATLQISEQGGAAISWHNETEGYYAGLFTDDTSADLQAMAESVGFGDRLPLSFLCKNGAPWDIWYPQQVPDGYCINRVSAVDAVTIDYTDGNSSITYVASFRNDPSADLGEPPHDSCTWTEEAVNGQAARMMTTGAGLRLLFWMDAREGFYAMLSVEDPNVDILAMAESVAPGAPLEIQNNSIGPDWSIEMQQDQTAYSGWESIYPQALPEGYTLAYVSDRAYGQQFIRYDNAAGDTISFTFYFRISEYGLDFSGMGTPQKVDINGNTGYLMDHALLWADAVKGYGYSLSATQDVDLVAIAKSVAAGPELTSSETAKNEQALAELGDYNITALPAGMEEDSFTGCPLEDGGGWYAYIRRWYYNRQTNEALYFTYESYVSDAASLEDIVQMQIGDARFYSADFMTINGCTGAASQLDNHAKVVWVQGTPAKGVCFQLISDDLSVEALLKIAESVQIQR